MDFTKKIDPYLFGLVKVCERKTPVSCVIYAKNYEKVKYFLKEFLSGNGKENSFYEYPFMNAFGIKVLSDNLHLIAKEDEVQYITANTKVFAQINVAKEVTHISQLNKKGYLGKDITIAFIDTGITPHIDFVCPNNRIILFKDFVLDKKVPYDDNGHGTFVAGVATGSGLISHFKYSGVAPKANIVSLKALDKNGETSAFSILQAMQWIYDNHKKYNIKVVCMSFGANPMNNGKDPLSVGAEVLWYKGITVVAAAGNSGPEHSSIKSPGVSSRIITVGALDDKRTKAGTFKKSTFEVADFSSRGPAYRFIKPDILAPGVNLTSVSNVSKKFYTELSGTSVATPIVAGLCSLIIEKYNKITPDEIKGLLIKNAYPIINDKNSEGYGLIDAIKLFEN